MPRGIPKILTSEVDRQMAQRGAEQFFNRKADPDASLSSEEFLKKKGNQFVMSKGAGKVLDSKVSRKVGIPVGNAAIKGVKGAGRALAKPFKWAGGQIEKEMRMNKAKDDRYKKEGKTLNRKYSGK